MKWSSADAARGDGRVAGVEGLDPDDSVVGRLRSHGLVPIIGVFAVTALTFAGVCSASDLSRLWLIAGVIVGGGAVLAFFSSRFSSGP